MPTRMPRLAKFAEVVAFLWVCSAYEPVPELLCSEQLVCLRISKGIVKGGAHEKDSMDSRDSSRLAGP
jgi:hypothetical protein